MAKMRKTTIIPKEESIVVEIDTNELVEEIVNDLIQEAIRHFNKVKNKVRDVEGDARYFYSDYELQQFMERIIYPDKVWVSTIKDSSGGFFAYRVGRIITNKGRLKRI